MSDERTPLESLRIAIYQTESAERCREFVERWIREHVLEIGQSYTHTDEVPPEHVDYECKVIMMKHISDKAFQLAKTTNEKMHTYPKPYTTVTKKIWVLV